MNIFRRIGFITAVGAITSASAFCSTVITYGFDSTTGKDTVTQTSTLPMQSLNINSPTSLFTFQDFASLGITNGVYVAGDTTFDYQFTNQVNTFTVTNNDSTTDVVNAQIIGTLGVDSTATLPQGTSGANNDYINAAAALNAGFTFSGTNPNRTVNPTLDQIVTTGSQTVASGATYSYPTPADQTFGIGSSLCTPTTFGDTQKGDGCALSLKQDTTYAGAGTVSWGLTEIGSFSFAGSNSNSSNVNLTIVGNTSYGAESEITYEYSVVVPPSTPEPTTMVLFGSALVGLGLLRKRVSRKQ